DSRDPVSAYAHPFSDSISEIPARPWISIFTFTFGRAKFIYSSKKKDGRIMAKDPVCGMMVDEKKAKFVSEHDGKSSTSAPRFAKYIHQGPTQVRSSKVKRSLGTTAYSSVPVASEWSGIPLPSSPAQPCTRPRRVR